MADVILTSQFTTPDKASFVDYLRYMTRKEALLKKEKETGELTPTERAELKLVSDHLERMKVKEGKTYRQTKGNAEDILGQEASDILSEANYYAEEKEQVQLTKKEEPIMEENNYLRYLIRDEAILKTDGDTLSGVFSMSNRTVTRTDMRAIEEIFKNCQKSGSVLWQDVISFRKGFLEDEGIKCVETGELDEAKLQLASRKMMDKMFETEKIKHGYWLASIHTNTDNVHIHFASIESLNNSKLIGDKFSGELVPKGKRSLKKTIEPMKSVFVNTLLDNEAQLSRMSTLRNDLGKSIKDDFNKQRKRKLKEIYTDFRQSLPQDKRYWNYGNVDGRKSKYAISDESREKLDKFVDELVKDNPMHEEYQEMILKEGKHNAKIYGKSAVRYVENRQADTRRRLGNAVLSEMKKLDKEEKSKRQKKFKRKRIVKSNIRKMQWNERKIDRAIKFVDDIVRTQELQYIGGKVNRLFSEDIKKWRAARAFEKTQRAVEFEQQRQGREL